MPSKAEELKLDIKELEELSQQAKRQKTKDVLTLELRKLQTDLSKLVEESSGDTTNSTNNSATQVPNATKKCYDVKLNNYGWDQTNTLMKLYITLKDVHHLPKDAVTCNFTEKSLDLRIFGLDNKNYNLLINNLCEEIDTEKSSVKVKTDLVLITLVKMTPKQWSHVTGVEKRIKEAKTSSMTDMGEDNTTEDSMIDIMKKIYMNGDDEIKRTMAKVWTESQQKNANFS